jgi:hypothetical protein
MSGWLRCTQESVPLGGCGPWARALGVAPLELGRRAGQQTPAVLPGEVHMSEIRPTRAWRHLEHEQPVPPIGGCCARFAPYKTRVLPRICALPTSTGSGERILRGAGCNSSPTRSQRHAPEQVVRKLHRPTSCSCPLVARSQELANAANHRPDAVDSSATD